ncbi:MAG: M20 family metallopeptidase [Traorella sp.]
MSFYDEAIKYVENSQDECIELIERLCLIPSFSHHEEKKAEFIQQWFRNYGIDAQIDDKKNVLVFVNADLSTHLVIFAAHIDTVFPDETGFVCRKENGFLLAPGVGDDTANVAQLMLIARYLIHHASCPQGCLFVFNSCEEGLGNLEGSKFLLANYQNRIQEFYTFDLGYDRIICKAVGSLRYKVDVFCEGGHSYGNFGDLNAIALASEMITSLYQYEVPKRGKSTYNVGLIEGGTSINTIAQKASFYFEYRSDDKQDLDEMIQYFERFIKEYQAKGYMIQIQLIGQRECGKPLDETKMNHILERASNIIQQFSHQKPLLCSGSTDCNASYALQIPGCCFGGYLGSGAHTREEKLEIQSLKIGMKILMTFILDYFEKA